ncbi:hypothetical protein [Mycolicibacterium llatzerense]|uniref:Helix-turn-helix domain-containing protein n=1 Tax=Mycolicibacterium llatzerense TaxID=280871 RepID=A0A0D1LIK6_9MYCO|nr:hypothetical protein [Mycolicibacterium llatzerense]KIU18312.1 hypothetical protein TL10_02330 [Mycolicibacterium llatzerense]
MQPNRKPPQPPTRWRKKPWPWPGDSREDKAKRVARSYRDLAERLTHGRVDNPGAELYLLDQYWAEYDVHWQHEERIDILEDRDDEWMPARDLAHAVDRDRKDIYNWARAGHIKQRAGADGTPEYHVGSVKAYVEKLRQRRSRNRAGEPYE